MHSLCLWKWCGVLVDTPVDGVPFITHGVVLWSSFVGKTFVFTTPFTHNTPSFLHNNFTRITPVFLWFSPHSTRPITRYCSTKKMNQLSSKGEALA